MSKLQYQPRIARKLLAFVVFFSGMIALVITLVQLWMEYADGKSMIETRMQQVQDSYVPAMVEDVWEDDIDQLQIHVDGIARLPHMQYVVIRTDYATVDSGTPQDERIIRRTFPIVYDNGREATRLGTLEAVASLEGIYQDILQRAWRILIGNTIKTFLVSIFLLLVFQRLVTRHLTVMADYARRLNLGGLDTPLTLPRKPSGHAMEDELGHVADALNTMRVNLRSQLAERKEAELLTAQRTAILEAMHFAGDALLKATSWETVIGDVFARFAQPLKARGIRLFQNRSDGDGVVAVALPHPWTTPVAAAPREPACEIRLVKEGHDDWAAALAAGELVCAPAREFLGDAADPRADREATSVLAAPIMVGGDFWGILLLEGPEALWSRHSRQGVEAMAEVLGAAIHRRNVEQALRASEHRYRDVVERSPIPICVYQEGCYRYVNPAAVAMHGAARAELRAGRG